MSKADGSPVLLYDGVCAYCNWIVRFIARIDKRAYIRFAPLQSDLGKAVLARHPEVAKQDTALLIERFPNGVERVSPKWQMTRRLFPYLTGFWKLGCMLLALLPLPLGNVLYDFVARIRYRLFGKYEVCKIPEEWLRRRLADFPPS